MTVLGKTNLELVKEALKDEAECSAARMFNPPVFEDGKYAINPRAKTSEQVPFCPDCKANHATNQPCEGRT